ncbi:MAG: ABC transporter permease [Candidatus Limnocylindrales bacterium]
MTAAPAAGAGVPGLMRRAGALVALPLISIGLALVVGAVIILGSEILIPGQTFDPLLPIRAYGALVQGAIGVPPSLNAIVNTFVATAPLVLAGLSVGFGFKAGLFNIGAQGQFLVGALGAVAAGIAVSSQPSIIAIPIALAGGMLAGAAWGFIPGILKATSGAHEVVTTIMLNYVAISLVAAVVSGPLNVPGAPSPITPDVGNAALPIIIGRNAHLGLLIALGAVGVMSWLLNRTTFGFEVRTVGANPDAARYAGMHPRRLIVVVMSICGLLSGLAGAGDILGNAHHLTSSYGTTVGFDSIAVALLGRSNPVGILFAALLFGGMRAGAPLMQISAGIPAQLVDVLQATILLFLVAAPVLRRVLHLRGTAPTLDVPSNFTRTYGGGDTATE